MLLKCAKCGVKNYLDPYPFWNFKGKTKCAGCDSYYAIEIANGSPVKPPERTTGSPKALVGAWENAMKTRSSHF